LGWWTSMSTGRLSIRPSISIAPTCSRRMAFPRRMETRRSGSRWCTPSACTRSGTSSARWGGRCTGRPLPAHAADGCLPPTPTGGLCRSARTT
jgi:hypothetical protein